MLAIISSNDDYKHIKKCINSPINTRSSQIKKTTNSKFSIFPCGFKTTSNDQLKFLLQEKKNSHNSSKLCLWGHVSYRMQSCAHDRYKEAIVEVVQELGAYQGMSDLDHSIAELQRVHEQSQWRHTHPVFLPQGMPVISLDIDLPWQRRVKST